MKDWFIFLGGVVLKSVVGFLIGGLIKTSVKKERKLIIDKHVFENHPVALKLCGIDRCSQL